jgi:hypothetical protein
LLYTCYQVDVGGLCTDARAIKVFCSDKRNHKLIARLDKKPKENNRRSRCAARFAFVLGVKVEKRPTQRVPREPWRLSPSIHSSIPRLESSSKMEINTRVITNENGQFRLGSGCATAKKISLFARRARISPRAVDFASRISFFLRLAVPWCVYFLSMTKHMGA